MAIIIDGKKVASDIKNDIIRQSAELPRQPGLAVILIGDDPASRLYVNNKEKDCIECGFFSREYKLDVSTTEDELLAIINELNNDESIDGILLQLPIPEHINEKRVLEAIKPDKDVDAFHPVNVGKMVIGDPVLWPCTPGGIMELFYAYDIDIDGKICVMVGRSNIVGKPMTLLMLRHNGTVISCHSHTKDLAEITRQADVLVVATGNRNLITGDMVKQGAVVIDVAMNRDPDTGKFTGDCVFSEVEKKASYITPVPGGVGPMTRAMLMKNILNAAKIHMDIT